MNILVIGHSVADLIDSKGEKKIQPGGIYYTITALNNIKKYSDEISLVTAIDDTNYYLFKDEYEKLHSKFFNKVDKIPKVHLKIEEIGERHEAYENINQNLQFNVKDLNRFDGILINMITGFDITLEQIVNIRKNYSGLIYFDVHTFSRGLDDKMRRYFRLIPQFDKWACNFDFIQVNKNELYCLSDKKNEEEIASEVLGYGTRYLILTLEDKGAKIFYKENHILKKNYEPAVKINVRNKVGCGDVFGAVFFYSYISQGEKNIAKVLETANRAAGFAASCAEISEFKNMKRDVFLRLY